MPFLLDETAIFGTWSAIFLGIPFAIAYFIMFVIVAFRTKGEKRIGILLAMVLLAFVIFPYIFGPLKYI